MGTPRKRQLKAKKKAKRAKEKRRNALQNESSSDEPSNVDPSDSPSDGPSPSTSANQTTAGHANSTESPTLRGYLSHMMDTAKSIQRRATRILEDKPVLETSDESVFRDTHDGSQLQYWFAWIDDAAGDIAGDSNNKEELEEEELDEDEDEEDPSESMIEEEEDLDAQPSEPIAEDNIVPTLRENEALILKRNRWTKQELKLPPRAPIATEEYEELFNKGASATEKWYGAHEAMLPIEPIQNYYRQFPAAAAEYLRMTDEYVPTSSRLENLIKLALVAPESNVNSGGGYINLVEGKAGDFVNASRKIDRGEPGSQRDLIVTDIQRAAGQLAFNTLVTWLYFGMTGWYGNRAKWDTSDISELIRKVNAGTAYINVLHYGARAGGVDELGILVKEGGKAYVLCNPKYNVSKGKLPPSVRCLLYDHIEIKDNFIPSIESVGIGPTRPHTLNTDLGGMSLITPTLPTPLEELAPGVIRPEAAQQILTLSSYNGESSFRITPYGFAIEWTIQKLSGNKDWSLKTTNSSPNKVADDILSSGCRVVFTVGATTAQNLNLGRFVLPGTARIGKYYNLRILKVIGRSRDGGEMACHVVHMDTPDPNHFDYTGFMEWIKEVQAYGLASMLYMATRILDAEDTSPDCAKRVFSEQEDNDFFINLTQIPRERGSRVFYFGPAICKIQTRLNRGYSFTQAYSQYLNDYDRQVASIYTSTSGEPIDPATCFSISPREDKPTHVNLVGMVPEAAALFVTIRLGRYWRQETLQLARFEVNPESSRIFGRHPNGELVRSATNGSIITFSKAQYLAVVSMGSKFGFIESSILRLGHKWTPPTESEQKIIAYRSRLIKEGNHIPVIISNLDRDVAMKGVPAGLDMAFKLDSRGWVTFHFATESSAERVGTFRFQGAADKYSPRDHLFSLVCNHDHEHWELLVWKIQSDTTLKYIATWTSPQCSVNYKTVLSSNRTRKLQSTWLYKCWFKEKAKTPKTSRRTDQVTKEETMFLKTLITDPKNPEIPDYTTRYEAAVRLNRDPTKIWEWFRRTLPDIKREAETGVATRIGKLTLDDVTALRAERKKNKKPSDAKKQQIAASLGRSLGSIRTWFNIRMYDPEESVLEVTPLNMGKFTQEEVEIMEEEDEKPTVKRRVELATQFWRPYESIDNWFRRK